MENCIIRSSRVHFVSNEVLPLVLESRSSKCSSPRSLVDCGQKRNVRNSTSNSLLLKSISDRRYTISKQWTSNTTFSTKSMLRKEPRIITMALGSDTGNDAEFSLSRETRRNPGWSLSDNLRCDVFVSYL